MKNLRARFSMAAYETLGAELCDEIAAEFLSQHETNDGRVMQKQTKQGQVSGLVKSDSLHIRLAGEPMSD